VVLVERDPKLARALLATRDRLGAQDDVAVQRGDGILALRSAAPASLDLVFLDPPYDSGLLAAALEAAVPALKPGGWVYAEDRRRLAACPPELQLCRTLKAGAVHAHLLQRQP
jgi:16S rRNA G966 N2-methylase RsmD